MTEFRSDKNQPTMPASRWTTNLLYEMLGFYDPDEATLEELIFKPIVPQVVEKDSKEDKESLGPSAAEEEAQIPSELPVLPLRSLVVFPQTAVPLTIGQPRSIRLVDDVVASDERLIALVASRDAELEVPGPDDLYSVGTVAMVHRLETDAKYTLDGKESTVSGITGREMKATAKVEGEKIVIDSKGSFQTPQVDTREVSTHEEYTLSAEGKMLTITTTRPTPQGDRTSKQVFNKQ